MADRDSPHRIIKHLLPPNKLLTNSSDDDEDKLSEQDEASSNYSKIEEDGSNKGSAEDETRFTADEIRRSLSAVSPRGNNKFQQGDDIHYLIESVENDAEDCVQLDHFVATGRISSVTLEGPNCTFKLPEEIAKELLKHQLGGLKWLWSLHCQGKGGILGDDMGLGKTRQICSFLAGLFYSRLIKRALIVVPKTLITHWVKELSDVGLSEKTRVYHGTFIKAQEEGLNCIHQDEGVIVTTYGMVHHYSKSLRESRHLRPSDEKIRGNPEWPDYVILDEGHQIKNPDTHRAQSLLEIPCAHRLALSGTPWQNNLKEMWALFNFCNPGLLGDKIWFEIKFESYILWGRDKRATKVDRRLASSAAKELRDLIQPYFLRRTKSEVVGAKISNKQDVVVWLRLNNVQRYLYQQFLMTVNVKSCDGAPFAALEIMRKICDHPLLLNKRDLSSEGKYKKMLRIAEADLVDELAVYKFNKVEPEISCKISFIMSLLVGAKFQGNLIPQGHHVLIFSGSLKMLDLIQESLSSKGYEFLRIDGTTKPKDRTKIVDDFQQHGLVPILLLSSKVGGLGLTLTRADRVIVTGPDWNPSTDDQIVDRACRIGQTKDVVAYRLITCGTFEEKAYRKQVFKDGLCKTGIEHKEKPRHFSRKDLRYLFTLPEEGFDVSVTQKHLEKKHDWEETMDESFKEHIDFLRSLGIAGVSHHNALLSIEASEDEDDPKHYETTRAESAFYSERPKWGNTSSSPNSLRKLSELFARKDEGVIVTTYGMVRDDSELLIERRHLRYDDERSRDGSKWPDATVDEGHQIKNPNTQRAQSLLEIPCAHRLVRSGTPWQNNLKVFKDGLCKTGTEHKEKPRYFIRKDLIYLFPPQLYGEVKRHGVAISSPTTRRNQIKQTQCQTQKSNESITSCLIHRAKRLFKKLR